MDNSDGKAIFPKSSIRFNKTDMIVEVINTEKNFCEEIVKLEESKTFTTHKWNNSEGTSGTVKILEEGAVFDKIAVCTTVAHGNLPKSLFLLMKNRNESENFPQDPTYFTTGVNGVAYPKNPHIPALNFSYRYFEMTNDKETIWWFGGGTDLTPYILNEEDCVQFHKVLKICCDKFDKNSYRTFKKSCDDYFYLDHRGERRGIGGIFFNELNSPNQDECFQFVSNCMKNIIPSYMPIVIKNKDKSYLVQDKEWKLLLRGRCVEFCFICDKATNLLLKTTDIQCENIFVCLPPSAKWGYNYVPDKKSKEYALLNVLRNPVDWV